MTTYRVSFERIGRDRVAPLVVSANDADDLAKHIHKYARTHLRSRGYAVEVDLEERTGFIACGFHSGGNFTIAEVEATEKAPKDSA